MNLKEYCLNNNKEYLLDEWAEINILPEHISPTTKRRIQWKCQYNHFWIARVDSRVNGTNCPYCNNKKILKGFNDFKTYCLHNRLEQLLKEYNDSIPIDEIFPFSNKRVQWKCNLGHTWMLSPNNRITAKTQCPYCSGKKILKGFNDFRTYCLNNNKEYLLNEWDYNKNNIAPELIAPFANKKVWWKCINNHSWSATVGNRMQHRNCPYCNSRTSFGEQSIYYYLKDMAINRYKYKNKEIDIYLPNKNIGIEFNGIYWHKNRKNKDIEKEQFLNNNDIKMFYVCESLENKIINNKIYFDCKHKYNDNLELAIKNLFKILNINIDINIKRDQNFIYKNIFLTKKHNSFAEQHKKLLQEWDYNKNSINPYNITSHSAVSVWWKCANGHSWKAKIYNRVDNHNHCPYC